MAGAVWLLIIVAIALQCRVYAVAQGAPIPWWTSVEWAVKDWGFWVVGTPLLLPWLDRYRSHRRATILIGALVCSTAVLISLGFSTLAHGNALETTIRQAPRAAMVYALVALGWNLYRPWIGSVESSPTVHQKPSGLWLVDGPEAGWLDYDDIEHLSAAGNYVEVGARDQTHLIRRTLSSIESELPTEHFARVHRSHIVNCTYVDGVRRQDGRYRVVLRSGRMVPVSRRYQPAVIARFRS